MGIEVLSVVARGVGTAHEPRRMAEINTREMERRIHSPFKDPRE